MKFDENLLDISDGKLYSKNDMVRVGCNDCAGCSLCCEEMGDTILLDPYDIYRLSKGLAQDFAQLMETERIELHMEEGLILPNLKMNAALKCSFLNAEGRCSIHEHRPGICRLFPLGRSYSEGNLDYFVLTDACPAMNKSKVKVDKWLGTPDMKTYEQYLVDWHEMTKRMRAEILTSEDENYRRQTSALFLKLFYEKPYEGDFYQDFYQRRALIL